MKGTVRGKGLWAASIAAGAFVGFGIGFRQDSIIAAPIALLCLLVFHRASRWPARVVAAALFLCALLPPALPVFRMNLDSGGNNAFYLNQGFSEDALRTLELEPSSITPYHSLADGIVHAYVHRFAQHRDYPFVDLSWSKQTAADWRAPFLALAQPLGVPTLYRDVARLGIVRMWGANAERVARDQFASVVRLMPADFLARAYAAVLVSIRGMSEHRLARSGEMDTWVGDLEASRRPVLNHLARFGPLYAAAALALLAAKSVWLAAGFLAIALYFLGYPSLLFQERHAFHLAFACWWSPLFLLNAGTSAVLYRRDIIEHGRRVPAMFAKAAAFLAMVALLLVAPMGAARAIQHRQLADYAAAIDTLELEPVEFSGGEAENWDRMYELRHAGLFRELDAETWWSRVLPTHHYPDIATEYLVAEIVTEHDPLVTLRWRTGEMITYCSLPPSPKSGPGTYRVYFPVFAYSDRFQESAYPNDMFDFDALILDKFSELKGLYRATDTEALEHLMVYWKPDRPADLVTAKGLRWWPEDL